MKWKQGFPTFTSEPLWARATVGSIYYWKYYPITEQPPRQKSLWIRPWVFGITDRLAYMQTLPLISHVIYSPTAWDKKNNTCTYRTGSVGPHPVHKQTITPLFSCCKWRCTYILWQNRRTSNSIVNRPNIITCIYRLTFLLTCPLRHGNANIFKISPTGYKHKPNKFGSPTCRKIVQFVFRHPYQISKIVVYISVNYFITIYIHVYWPVFIYIVNWVLK